MLFRPRIASLSPPDIAPDSISEEDWQALKADRLTKIVFNGSSQSAEHLAQALKENHTLVELNSNTGRNCDDMLFADAIVKSRNPNFLFANLDGINGASEIILPTDHPIEIKRLNVLRQHNRDKASLLLDMMMGDPSALTTEDRVQIKRREAAIRALAHERKLDDNALEDLFARSHLPPPAPASSPPFDATLEEGLKQHPEFIRPSTLKMIADTATFMALIAKGSYHMLRQDRNMRRQERNSTDERGR